MHKLYRCLFYITSVIILLSACSESQNANTRNTAVEATVDPEASADTITEEDAVLNVLDSLICRDTVVALATMIRKTNMLDIDNIFGFLCRPTEEARVIVVPEDPVLQPYDLEVVRSIPRDDFNPGQIEWFEVYLQSIGITEFSPIYNYKQDSSRAWEYPGDVAVIYPYMEHAKSLDKDNLNEIDLPENVRIGDVKIAIDWTINNKPDAIISEYCCDENDKPSECEYTCGDTYIKKGMKWVLVYESSPA